MTLKISEMFEHAAVNTDAIQLTEDTGVDKARIRQMVLHKINGRPAGIEQRAAHTKKISRRIAIIAVAIVVMLMSALGANAATGGKLFGAILLNNENRYLAKEPTYVSMQAVSPGATIVEPQRPVQSSKIINQNQLQKLGAVTNIPVEHHKGNYAIPQVLTNNGAPVIFTKADESGWHLNKGETLSIRFKLNLTTSKYSDPAGEWMEIGYIHNGTLVAGFAKKLKEFSYTLTADEAGTYYFYALNESAGHIIISSGTIQ